MSSSIGWIKGWNTILRKVIFPDYYLTELMKLPQKTTIIQFRDKYFIRAGFTNKLLENESVRIVYSDVPGQDTDVPNVKRNMMLFDIYVKLEDLYNAGEDRLMMRTQLIAARLIQLLTSERYIKDTGYRFWVAGEWDAGTKTVGYARYVVAFNYMKVY